MAYLMLILDLKLDNMWVNNMKKLKKKTKITIALFGLFLFVYITLNIIKQTYASYESNSELNLNISNALYVFKEGKLNFNIDLNKLVPSEDAYEYYFTIANYNDSKRSDVDIEYTIKMLTTTNLPLEYELYYNDTNIIEDYSYMQDEDLSWYKVMNIPSIYQMNYNSSILNTYKLVVYFPIEYALLTGYDGLVDNIEIEINSKQIID